jgi:colanic acid/amylovoran biosynthesis protein
MISGLAMGVPVVVLGWSHKYREVLREFGLEHLAFDFGSAGEAGVSRAVESVLGQADEIRAVIAEVLPRVVESAGKNLTVLRRVSRRRGPS